MEKECEREEDIYVHGQCPCCAPGTGTTQRSRYPETLLTSAPRLGPALAEMSNR